MSEEFLQKISLAYIVDRDLASLTNKMINWMGFYQGNEHFNLNVDLDQTFVVTESNKISLPLVIDNSQSQQPFLPGFLIFEENCRNSRSCYFQSQLHVRLTNEIEAGHKQNLTLNLLRSSPMVSIFENAPEFIRWTYKSNVGNILWSGTISLFSSNNDDA